MFHCTWLSVQHADGHGRIQFCQLEPFDMAPGTNFEPECVLRKRPPKIMMCSSKIGSGGHSELFGIPFKVCSFDGSKPESDSDSTSPDRRAHGEEWPGPVDEQGSPTGLLRSAHRVSDFMIDVFDHGTHLRDTAPPGLLSSFPELPWHRSLFKL